MKKLSKATKAQRFKKKVAEYAKFLKDDFDFDWTYILLLLRYKLGRTRECLANGHHLHRDRDAAEIKEVEDFLLKVLDHNYHEEAFKAFYKKHGKPKMVFLECVPPNKHAKRCEFIYKNGKPATKAMNKEHVRLADKEFEAQKTDLRKAFDIMAEKIWGWWD